jgi:hypothetical protein
MTMPSPTIPVTEPETSLAHKPVRTLLPYPWALWFWRHARKWVVAVVGGTLLLLGILMLVVPGPGWVTIFGALALLATEFAWARWTLKYAQERLQFLMESTGMATKSDAPPVEQRESTT